MPRLRFKMSRRWGLALAALVALGGIAVFFLLDDEPPVDDTDLVLVRRSVPDEENGFLDIDFGKEAMYWPSDEDLYPADEDEDLVPEVDPEERFAPEIVDRNADALRKLEVALEKKDFQLPPVQDVRVPRVGAFLQLGRALLWRSRLHARAGRDRESLQDTVRLFRFGKKVLAGQGLLIDAMVGFSIQAEALGEIRTLAASPGLTPDDSRSCLRALKPSPDERIALSDTLREEYRVWAAALAAAGDPRRLNLYLHMGLEGWRSALLPWTRYKPNLTRRRFAEGTRELIRRTVPAMAAEGEDSELPDGFLSFLANGSGDLFVDFLLTANQKLIEAALDAEVDLEATRAIVAIRAFEKMKGHLPVDLDQLVPDFLEAVLRDPFDGKPLRYLPAKRIVYSIGSDLIDRGGSTDGADVDACHDELDPTFRIGGR